MKKTVSLLLLSVVLCTILTCGCALTARPQYEKAVYDLQQPQTAQKQTLMNVVKVINTSPAHSNMFYRLKNNQVVSDPFTSWTQPPDKLLNRFFNHRFPMATTSQLAKTINIKLEITAFEFDIPSGDAVLSLWYIMEKDSKQKAGSILVREKFSAKDAAAFAAAMSRASERAANELEHAAQNFTR